MTKGEIVKVASYALMKGYDYETICFCDEMYGKEEFMDQVWDIVIEAQENGMVWFRTWAKENEYEIYPV